MMEAARSAKTYIIMSLICFPYTVLAYKFQTKKAILEVVSSKVTKCDKMWMNTEHLNISNTN